MDKELPVSVWPEWRIVEKIGEGSFGKVYKAERCERGRSFYSAIKIITIPSSQSELNSVRSETTDEKSTREYFQNLVEECIQEVSTMEYFRGNSHVVSVEDFKVVEYLDVIGWDIYIRMEYLTSFIDYCTGKSLSEEEVVRLGIDLCKTLQYCRKLNIIHRDIKPENIFVSRFGDFKLGDFGIARELERSMSGLSKKGTFSYMAPEMYRGEQYDSRVDIYSLGLVLYKLMNHNRLPFLNLEKQLITYRDKENALARRMSGETPPKPADAGTQFGEIILKACAYRPEQRYQEPEDFRRDMERLQNGTYEQPENSSEAVVLQETEEEKKNRLERERMKRIWGNDVFDKMASSASAQAEEAASQYEGTRQQNSDSKQQPELKYQLESEQQPNSKYHLESGQQLVSKQQSIPTQQSSLEQTYGDNSVLTKTTVAKSASAKPASVKSASGKSVSGKSSSGKSLSGKTPSGKSASRSQGSRMQEIKVQELPPIRTTGTRHKKKKQTSVSPWTVAVIVVAIAACIITAVYIKLLLDEPMETETQDVSEFWNNSTYRIDVGDSNLLAEEIQNIKSKATAIVSELDTYDQIGQEGKKLHYLKRVNDNYEQLMKALVYPEVSDEGLFEEYYYWDEELFFAYIWGNDKEADLYYYKGGELIRWIDKQGICHDDETDNKEYVERGNRYWEKSLKELEPDAMSIG